MSDTREKGHRTTEVAAPRPRRLGTAVYAACLLTAWSIAALFTAIGGSIGWHHPRWKTAVACLVCAGLATWLGFGVWDLVRASASKKKRRATGI